MGKIEKIEKLAGKGKVEKVLKFVGDKDKEVRLAVIAGVAGKIENEDVRKADGRRGSGYPQSGHNGSGKRQGKLCGDQAEICLDP